MANTITVRPDGPLLCKGDIEVYNATGELIEHSDDVALCRCGASPNKPFCDGSHKQTGFCDDARFSDDKAEPLEASEGPLQITVRSHAMLVAKGPMTIEGADGSRTTRNRAAFCRCGESKKKPFCDISHKAAGFEAE